MVREPNRGPALVFPKKEGVNQMRTGGKKGEKGEKKKSIPKKE